MTNGPPVLVSGPRHTPSGGPGAEDDRQLLERFVSRGDEDAFAVLVARHGASVLGVCRRVLRHEQDAEDASQAVFLVLARKAAVVPWEPSVKHWLQAVAYRLALRVRGSAARRRLFEKPVGALAPCTDDVGQAAWDRLPEQCHPQADPLTEIGRRELQRVIADELDGLPEKYQAPVVLCYLEGKTNEEAAGQLGWPSGSMSRRLARARALLQERLTRRGLACVFLLAGLSAPVLFWWANSVDRQARRETQLAQAMAPFRSTNAGGQGIESELLRLAENRGLEADHERLIGMARQTARVAAALEHLVPDRRQEQWRVLSAEMRASAIDLVAALDAREEKAVFRAARTLTASCQRCHVAFRD